MNLNTVTALRHPKSAAEITDWSSGAAWLAGGTWRPRCRNSRNLQHRVSSRFSDQCADPSSNANFLQSDGRALYELLIGPIADDLTSERLLVVEPDDDLESIPFAALSDSSGHYMGARFTLLSSPGRIPAALSEDRVLFSRMEHVLAVDPAVSEFAYAVLGFKLKVLRLATAPDDEAVSLEQIKRRHFAHQFTVFGAPICRVAVPSIESLAVEDLPEAGVAVIERKDLRDFRWRLEYRMREKRDRSREQGTKDHHKGGAAQSACVTRKPAPESGDESHDSNDNARTKRLALAS